MMDKPNHRSAFCLREKEGVWSAVPAEETAVFKKKSQSWRSTGVSVRGHTTFPTLLEIVLEDFR
jgi:hypothetical protein